MRGRRNPSRPAALIFAALTLAAFPAAAASAKDRLDWKVHGTLTGKDGEASIDISGIACETSHGFPRRCLVIDDELQDAQFVTLDDGKITAGDAVPLIDDQYKDEPVELDGEGVAYADGYYYVIGSHGYPRHTENKSAGKIQARVAASSQIVRVWAKHPAAAPERSGKLRDIIADDPVLSAYLDKELKDNGVTIEGIAVRGNRLFVGFRGPVLDDGRAVVLSVAVDFLFGAAPPDPRRYPLPLGEARGVRDLAPFGDGILILAGPAADKSGPYAVFRWDGQSESVVMLADLASLVGNEGERKAEALLPLDNGPSGLRVLIMFDGEKNGAPAALEIPMP